MHEVLFDDAWLRGTGVTTLDFAKAMIDEGYHPMTIYFPLVAHGAMLIEPTESESKASLDLFIATLRDLGERALRGEAEALPRGAASCAAPPSRRNAGGAQTRAALAARMIRGRRIAPNRSRRPPGHGRSDDRDAGREPLNTSKAHAGGIGDCESLSVVIFLCVGR